MDNISEIYGMQGIGPIQGMNGQKGPQGNEGGPPPPPQDMLQISGMGQLFSAVEEAGGTAHSELQQFHESLFEALKSGSFNAEEFVENASETIKSLAEEAGIDLTETVSQFAENTSTLGMGPAGMQQGHRPPPPPPPSSEDLYAEDDEEDETNTASDLLGLV